MPAALAVHVGTDLGSAASSATGEGALRTLVEGCLPPKEIAEALGLPPTITVQYQIEEGDGKLEQDGVLQVDFSVRTAPELADLLSTNLDAEIGDLVLERLNGRSGQLPSGTDDAPATREVELRLRVADQAPVLTSSARLAAKAGFAPNQTLGWGKGCNSWPW
jgi:hypothetical protein